jgi:cyclohexa-1,5-dienecarbonyl-CoA hydratase
MTTTLRSRLTLAVEPPRTRITLSNPPLNVIDIPMMEELAAALAEVEARPEISTIVLAGSGKAFSAGVDVAAHTPDRIQEMLGKFHAVMRALVASRKVTIAQVHGHCLGGGAELALVCDMVYTADSAQWGFPEIRLACYPPVAATALAALIGQKAAAELILTGRAINGTEAAAMGLANRALPESEVRQAVDDSLERIAGLSPAALAITKKALYAWDAMHFDKGLSRAEKIYVEELMQTEDAQEGVQAFLEKREPRWKSR